MISAQDTGHPTSANGENSYQFSVDPAKLAASLRSLADRIEEHKVVPLMLVTAQIGKLEDYVIQRLVLNWSEKKE